MKNYVSILGVSKKYQTKSGEVTALDKVDLQVAEGEIVAIVGRSGCGKSTLLSIVAGLITPTEGKIFIEGEEVRGADPRTGYMLQRDNLLEWRTILQNILFGLEVQHKMTEENIAYARHLIYEYGLGDFEKSYPSELSGGMRQRAALIRTLAVRPKLLLLDEAFSALDYQTRLLVTDNVRKILCKEKMTTLMVSHDIPESISMADRIVVLAARPGRVKDVVAMDFDKDAAPIARRGQAQFQTYFNRIWGELNG